MLKLLLVFGLLSLSVYGQEVTGVEFLSDYKLPGVSIRAIEVTDEHTLWFAGSSGRYGRISNDGMELDSISHEGSYPSFRSIAYNGRHIFLLSIESPALLYKIDPKKPFDRPELVYREDNPKAFYDSLTFFDQDNGLAMGDPTDQCLSVLKTSDGGQSWTKLSCETLPQVMDGEAAFAASNTNIATFGKNAWLVTGGKKARVFKTVDLGATWDVSETPIVQGEKMTGIFTTDFFDVNNGIVMGGNWESKDDNKNAMAVTQDGGLTWTTGPSDRLPGYISCVQYRPSGEGRQILAVSTEGIYFSGDSGVTWNKIEEKGYFSVRFIDAEHAWLSKNEEIAKIKFK
jgi:hypothetical protein